MDGTQVLFQVVDEGALHCSLSPKIGEGSSSRDLFAGARTVPADPAEGKNECSRSGNFLPGEERGSSTSAKRIKPSVSFFIKNFFLFARTER